MAANGQTAELLKHSVTAGDAALSGGVVQFIFPVMGAGMIYGLPQDLPIYWSYERDMVLRNTIQHESMWAAAVAIACTKQATMNFEVKSSSDGDVSRTIDRYQSMLLQWGGREGYVMSQSKGVTDFLTTNNGEFHEIVRVSNASGSRVLGLVHLDSMRCMRTGDPAHPVLFRDLQGHEHLMKDYQVIDLVDQPDPGLSWFGVGHCAAERAYRHIYKLAAIERYLLEKITGSGMTEIEMVDGPTQRQFEDARVIFEQHQAQRNAVYYGGKLIVFNNSDKPLAGHTIAVKSVPDGFDRKQELDIALLAYANSIGLVLTDLQPLSGQGLGTGAQTIVLEEKAHGRGLSARRKALGHKLNEWVLPSTVVSFFKERDLRDEATEATNAQTRAGVLETYATVGAITPAQVLQAAVDADDLPRAFIDQDETPNEALSDEDKPTVESSEPVDALPEEAPPAPPESGVVEANPVIQKEHVPELPELPVEVPDEEPPSLSDSIIKNARRIYDAVVGKPARVPYTPALPVNSLSGLMDGAWNKLAEVDAVRDELSDLSATLAQTQKEQAESTRSAANERRVLNAALDTLKNSNGDTHKLIGDLTKTLVRESEASAGTLKELRGELERIGKRPNTISARVVREIVGEALAGERITTKHAVDLMNKVEIIEYDTNGLASKARQTLADGTTREFRAVRQADGRIKDWELIK